MGLGFLVPVILCEKRAKEGAHPRRLSHVKPTKLACSEVRNGQQPHKATGIDWLAVELQWLAASHSDLDPEVRSRVVMGNPTPINRPCGPGCSDERMSMSTRQRCAALLASRIQLVAEAGMSLL
jgi:hypothetical protein